MANGRCFLLTILLFTAIGAYRYNKGDRSTSTFEVANLLRHNQPIKEVSPSRFKLLSSKEIAEFWDSWKLHMKFSSREKDSSSISHSAVKSDIDPNVFTPFPPQNFSGSRDPELPTFTASVVDEAPSSGTNVQESSMSGNYSGFTKKISPMPNSLELNGFQSRLANGEGEQSIPDAQSVTGLNDRSILTTAIREDESSYADNSAIEVFEKSSKRTRLWVRLRRVFFWRRKGGVAARGSGSSNERQQQGQKKDRRRFSFFIRRRGEPPILADAAAAAAGAGEEGRTSSKPSRNILGIVGRFMRRRLLNTFNRPQSQWVNVICDPGDPNCEQGIYVTKSRSDVRSLPAADILINNNNDNSSSEYQQISTMGGDNGGDVRVRVLDSGSGSGRGQGIRNALKRIRSKLPFAVSGSTEWDDFASYDSAYIDMPQGSNLAAPSSQFKVFRNRRRQRSRTVTKKEDGEEVEAVEELGALRRAQRLLARASASLQNVDYLIYYAQNQYSVALSGGSPDRNLFAGNEPEARRWPVVKFLQTLMKEYTLGGTQTAAAVAAASAEQQQQLQQQQQQQRQQQEHRQGLRAEVVGREGGGGGGDFMPQTLSDEERSRKAAARPSSGGADATASSLMNLVQAGKETILDAGLRIRSTVLNAKMPWDEYYRGEIPFFETNLPSSGGSNSSVGISAIAWQAGEDGDVAIEPVSSIVVEQRELEPAIKPGIFPTSEIQKHVSNLELKRLAELENPDLSVSPKAPAPIQFLQSVLNSSATTTVSAAWTNVTTASTQLVEQFFPVSNVLFNGFNTIMRRAQPSASIIGEDNDENSRGQEEEEEADMYGQFFNRDLSVTTNVDTSTSNAGTAAAASAASNIKGIIAGTDGKKPDPSSNRLDFKDAVSKVTHAAAVAALEIAEVEVPSLDLNDRDDRDVTAGDNDSDGSIVQGKDSVKVPNSPPHNERRALPVRILNAMPVFRFVTKRLYRKMLREQQAQEQNEHNGHTTTGTAGSVADAGADTQSRNNDEIGNGMDDDELDFLPYFVSSPNTVVDSSAIMMPDNIGTLDGGGGDFQSVLSIEGDEDAIDGGSGVEGGGGRRESRAKIDDTSTASSMTPSPTFAASIGLQNGFKFMSGNGGSIHDSKKTMIDSIAAAPSANIVVSTSGVGSSPIAGSVDSRDEIEKEEEEDDDDDDDDEAKGTIGSFIASTTKEISKNIEEKKNQIQRGKEVAAESNATKTDMTVKVERTRELKQKPENMEVPIPTKADFAYIASRRVEVALTAALSIETEADAREFKEYIGLKPLVAALLGKVPLNENIDKVDAVKSLCTLTRHDRSTAADIAAIPAVIEVLCDMMEAPLIGFQKLQSRVDRDRNLRAQTEATALIQRLVRSSDQAVECMRYSERLRRILATIVDLGTPMPGSISSKPPPLSYQNSKTSSSELQKRSPKYSKKYKVSKPSNSTTVAEYIDLTPTQMARVALYGLGGVQWKPRVPGQKGLRILSLDGGGTRGVLSIAYLKDIMQRVNSNLEPYQMFDLICGTSTGGIIACLLGAQRASLAETEILYDDFIEKVFGQRSNLRLVTDRAAYDENILEDILYEIAGDQLLLDSNQNDCSRVFCISTKVNVNPPQPNVWRNYNYPPGRTSRYPGAFRVNTFTAVRATTAAPTFFTPVPWENGLYCDGALVANNPTAIAMQEAKVLYPGVPIEMVLSIGTGYCNEESAVQSMGWDMLVNKLISSSTDTEDVHALLVDFLPPEKYFRFNPALEVDYPIDEKDRGILDGLKKVARDDVERKATGADQQQFELLLKMLRGGR